MECFWYYYDCFLCFKICIICSLLPLCFSFLLIYAKFSSILYPVFSRHLKGILSSTWYKLFLGLHMTLGLWDPSGESRQLSLLLELWWRGQHIPCLLETKVTEWKWAIWQLYIFKGTLVLSAGQNLLGKESSKSKWLNDFFTLCTNFTDHFLPFYLIISLKFASNQVENVYCREMTDIIRLHLENLW